MEQRKMFKILAAIFAMRSAYYQSIKEYGTAIAYDNAFDMFAYAAKGDWDCLSQFGWYDEAEALINEVGTGIDFWDLEDLIKKK